MVPCHLLIQMLLFLTWCVHCLLPGGQANLDHVRESHSKQLTDEQVVQKLPEELRRQSLSGSLPVSLQALRVGFTCCIFFPLVNELSCTVYLQFGLYLNMCIESNKTIGMFAFTCLAIHTRGARLMIHFTCIHERQKTCVYLKKQSGCAAIVLEPTVYTTFNLFVIIQAVSISLG